MLRNISIKLLNILRSTPDFLNTNQLRVRHDFYKILKVHLFPSSSFKNSIFYKYANISFFLNSLAEHKRSPASMKGSVLGVCAPEAVRVSTSRFRVSSKSVVKSPNQV